MGGLFSYLIHYDPLLIDILQSVDLDRNMIPQVLHVQTVKSGFSVMFTKVQTLHVLSVLVIS